MAREETQQWTPVKSRLKQSDSWSQLTDLGIALIGQELDTGFLGILFPIKNECTNKRTYSLVSAKATDLNQLPIDVPCKGRIEVKSEVYAFPTLREEEYPVQERFDDAHGNYWLGSYKTKKEYQKAVDFYNANGMPFGKLQVNEWWKTNKGVVACGAWKPVKKTSFPLITEEYCESPCQR